MDAQTTEFMAELFKQVLVARVYEVAIRTPLDEAFNLSLQCGNRVLLKREDLQPAFSFKIRGAFNRISNLSAAEKAAGIVCVSAGNHAQGVAISAKHLGIPATVVMPLTAPEIKVRAVRQQGAEVILNGDSYSEAAEYCKRLVEETGKTLIHPFDDPLVIAGQGTIAQELLEQIPDMHAVFVPVGGGGLIGGIAGFLKTLRPDVRIIGVQPDDSSAMLQSLEAGERVALKEVGILADGVAVKQVSELTFQLAKAYVDEIITVSTDEICSAIRGIYEDTRSIMEPAGALGVAGLKKYVTTHGVKEQNLVAVNSGANMNFARLQFVAERTLTGEKREALFAVTIPEKPGSLGIFCDNVMGERNITEFNYRLAGRGEAHIFVGVGIRSEAEKAEFVQLMVNHGFAHIDLTDNELAKMHIRHMVGGRSAEQTGEVLYRFEFPERPKALTEFLAAMSESWNISLFHYRMHGGDAGRVLVGFEIPGDDQQAFQEFLRDLHYPYIEETGNPAYKMFL